MVLLIIVCEFQALTSSASIEIVTNSSSVPEGCAIVPVSDWCEAYLLLKGFIDVKKEIERLKTKREKIDGPLTKLRAATEAPDYNEKVPIEVRTANTERLRQLELELEKVMEAIKGISFIND